MTSMVITIAFTLINEAIIIVIVIAQNGYNLIFFVRPTHFLFNISKYLHYYHAIHYIENGPIIKNGKKVSAVRRKVTTINTEMNKGPCVFIGSITSLLSLTVNEPAIANIKPKGTYLPRNITIAVETIPRMEYLQKFQNNQNRY